MIVSERNVLSYCVEQVFNDGSIDPIEWLETFAPPAIRDQLRDSLLEIVFEEIRLGTIDVAAIDSPRATEFRSVLFRTNTDAGTTHSIATFCFKDAGKQSIFALVAIALSLFAHTFGIGAAANLSKIGRALWSNFSLLRRPGDDAEINALESLIKIQAFHYLEGTNILPTTRAIAEELQLDPLVVLPAILNLERRNIVRSVIPVPGDANPPPSEMRWQLRF